MKSDEIWGNPGKSDEIWWNLRKSEEIWGNLMIWWNLMKSDEIWKIWGNLMKSEGIWGNLMNPANFLVHPHVACPLRFVAWSSACPVVVDPPTWSRLVPFWGAVGSWFYHRRSIDVWSNFITYHTYQDVFILIVTWSCPMETCEVRMITKFILY